ncbi:Retrovirus-related Pol polyprotein from transposon TNT 1-94 [Nymphaea thermarum]|nr:Retrovirus-related Pol polyprotein from transposon TNT 1-94 [Nymphaea thermarum]
MAKTTMLAFMEDDQIRVFEDCPTAKEMFDTITSKYNTMTTMHVQFLQEQYNSYRMKESDDVMDHVNKMLVIAKDLAVMGNVMSDNMQISTILNSLPPSCDMAVTALSVQFDNLTLEKLPLQLALQQQRLTKRNRAELMIVQEKHIGSHVSVKPKQFKNRNDGKFKGNFVGTKKSQGTVVKCYRCGKPRHIRKNCRTRFTNMKDNKGQGNYNRRKPQGDSNREVICVVSECLFADGDLTGWWVDLRATCHIAKTKEGVINMKNLSLGTHKIYMGNNFYRDVLGIGAYRLNVGGISVVLNEVLYVPSMRRNLVSVPALTGKGFEVRFIPRKITVGKHGRFMFGEKFVKEHGMFKLNDMNEASSSAYFDCAMSVNVNF